MLVVLPSGEAELQCGRINILAARDEFSAMDTEQGREEMNAMRQKETRGYGKEPFGKGKKEIGQGNPLDQDEEMSGQGDEALGKGQGETSPGQWA